MSKIIIDSVIPDDANGDASKTIIRVYREGDDPKLKGKALSFGARKGGMLEEIILSDHLRLVLSNTIAKTRANINAVRIPTYTLEDGGKTYGLFSNGTVQFLVKPDSGREPYYRKLGKGDESRIKAEHFGPNAVPIKETKTSATTGRTSTATKVAESIDSLETRFAEKMGEMQAEADRRMAEERRIMQEQMNADRQAMMEMMRSLMTANASK